MINGHYNNNSSPKSNGTEKCQLKCNTENEDDVAVNYIRNPYLDEDEDVLFHLTLSNKTHDLKAMFHDVKFVCMGGTVERMRSFAHFLVQELGLPMSKDEQLPDLTGKGNRYSMFKAGCVLCVNHGMGYPSIMILLHELIKLMHYAKARDPIFIRIGTCGGIDVTEGTVVIATHALSDFLEPCIEVPILGKKYKWPAILDQKLAQDLKEMTNEKFDFPVLLGSTASNEHFYESTAMKAGAICEHTDKDRKEYYHKLKACNVLSMDMEAIALAAITHKVGIRAAILNVVVNDCFAEKEASPSPEELKEWTKRPQRIIAEFVKKCYY